MKSSNQVTKQPSNQVTKQPSNQVTHNQLTKITFAIKGMHCASCVYTSEKALKAIPGVTDAVVNLATGKATLTTDSMIEKNKIIDAVKSAGYQAMFPSYAKASEGKEETLDDKIKVEKMKELKDLRIKVLALVTKS